MIESFESVTEEEIIDYLLEKCKDDADAVETVQRAITDIEYIRTKKEGQTPHQYLIYLAGHLEMWF